MGAFVSEIRLPRTAEPLAPAYPLANELGAINVLCGPANAGKSYILRRLRAALEALPGRARVHGTDIEIETTEPVTDPVSVLLFAKSWQDKEKIGSVPIQRESVVLPADRPKYMEARLWFLGREVVAYARDRSALCLSEWSTDRSAREESLAWFEDEHVIYRFRSGKAPVPQLETILGADLYFRKTRNSSFELVLRNRCGTVVPFSEWSDGQKSIAYLFVMMAFAEPQVLLLDELENHLHPTLMTRALQEIKGKVPQTFVATHHPHIIFTEFADKVFLIDIEETRGAPAPRTVRYTKIERQGAPARRVRTLEDSFSKVTATYRLFDFQDRQLLRQFSRVARDVDAMFYRALAGAFDRDVVAPGKKATPDRQTGQLASAIRSSLRVSDGEAKVRILDVGAGIGRVPAEVRKLTTWQIGGRIEWVCWERDERLHDRLRQNLHDSGIEAILPKELDEVEDRTCDLVLFANVVHELTPVEFAGLVHASVRKLVATGSIVALELYPLLSAEHFAVAYPESDLVAVLNNIGFACTSRFFPVNDAQAYCVVGRLTRLAERDEIQRAVERAWDALEVKACHSYAGWREIRTYEDYSAVIQELTTLASIAAWRNGLWAG